MKGIDISVHNKTVDFNAVKNSGIEVVIIKATEGVAFTDDLYEQHLEGVKKSGLNYGMYHFMSEKTSPTQQARDFWTAINSTGFNVIPCLDIESNNLGRSVKEITDRCIEFLNEFKRLSGIDCMIYSGGYFSKDLLDSRIKNYPLWVAHYGVDKPMKTGFSNVVGHQYTEHGSVNGVLTRVDMNNFTSGIFLGEAKPIKPSQSIDNKVSGLDKAKNYVGNRCVELQQKLISKGYNCGGYGSDGNFGQGTYDSLIAFQRDNGLTVDGLCGVNTWDKLNQQSNSWVSRLQEECNKQGFSNQVVDGIVGQSTLNGCPLIRQGGSGGITMLLQERLNALGYVTNGIDGIFGKGTYNAVVKFQRDKGLSADGIVGKGTWSKLLGI